MVIPNAAEVEKELDGAAARQPTERAAIALWGGLGALLLARNPAFLVVGDPRATLDNLVRAVRDSHAVGA